MVADLRNSSGTGGAPRPTVVLSLFGLDAPLVWVPDGRLIYALEEPRPRQSDSNLWWIRLNSQIKPDGPPVRLTNDSGAIREISVSGDSKRIAYTKEAPQPDVYVSKLQASGYLEEPQRLTLDDHQDLPFDWTTDNKSVIFISDRTGPFSIYKQSVDKTVPELLVLGRAAAPDGASIESRRHSDPLSRESRLGRRNRRCSTDERAPGWRRRA